MGIYLTISIMDITGIHIIEVLQYISIEDLDQCLCMHIGIQDSTIQDSTITINMNTITEEDVQLVGMTSEDPIPHIEIQILV